MRIKMNPNFVEEIKTWKGSKLVRYSTDDPEEELALQEEINRRLDKNVPVLAKSFSDWMNKLSEGEE